MWYGYCWVKTASCRTLCINSYIYGYIYIHVYTHIYIFSKMISKYSENGELNVLYIVISAYMANIFLTHLPLNIHTAPAVVVPVEILSEQPFWNCLQMACFCYIWWPEWCQLLSFRARCVSVWKSSQKCHQDKTIIHTICYVFISQLLPIDMWCVLSCIQLEKQKEQ